MLAVWVSYGSKEGRTLIKNTDPELQGLFQLS